MEQPGRRVADQQEWDSCSQQGVRDRDEAMWLARRAT